MDTQTRRRRLEERHLQYRRWFWTRRVPSKVERFLYCGLQVTCMAATLPPYPDYSSAPLSAHPDIARWYTQGKSRLNVGVACQTAGLVIWIGYYYASLHTLPWLVGYYLLVAIVAQTAAATKLYAAGILQTYTPKTREFNTGIYMVTEDNSGMLELDMNIPEIKLIFCTFYEFRESVRMLVFKFIDKTREFWI